MYITNEPVCLHPQTITNNSTHNSINNTNNINSKSNNSFSKAIILGNLITKLRLQLDHNNNNNPAVSQQQQPRILDQPQAPLWFIVRSQTLWVNRAFYVLCLCLCVCRLVHSTGIYQAGSQKTRIVVYPDLFLACFQHRPYYLYPFYGY